MLKKVSTVFVIMGLFLSVFSFGRVEAIDLFGGDVCKGTAKNSTVCKGSSEVGDKNPIFGPDGVLTTAIQIVSIIVGVVAVVMMMVGGFKLITSGTNPQDVSKARETIIYALVGVVVAAVAQVIVQFFLKRIN